MPRFSAILRMQNRSRFTGFIPRITDLQPAFHNFKTIIKTTGFMRHHAFILPGFSSVTRKIIIPVSQVEKIFRWGIYMKVLHSYYAIYAVVNGFAPGFSRIGRAEQNGFIMHRSIPAENENGFCIEHKYIGRSIKAAIEKNRLCKTFFPEKRVPCQSFIHRRKQNMILPGIPERIAAEENAFAGFLRVKQPGKKK